MNDLIKQLERLLLKEQDETNAFVDILEKEADILVSGAEPEALADITQTKWYRAHALNALFLERQALIATFPSRTDITAVSRVSIAIADAWNTLNARFQHAHDLNSRNGLMIEQLKKSTDDAMALLRSVRGQSDVYTATGRQASSSRRILATP